MKKSSLLLVSSFVSSLFFSQQVLSEAGYSYETDGTTTPTPVRANVKFEIKVPKLMILRVGAFNATVNKVTWNLSPTSAPALTTGGSAANADYAGPFPPTLSTGGVTTADEDDYTTSDGILDVGVWGNVGDISLTAKTISEFTAGAGGTTKPSVADISATDGGSITHPTLVATTGSTSAAVSLTASSGVVNLADTWTYKYNYTVASLSAGNWVGAEVQYIITAP